MSEKESNSFARFILSKVFLKQLAIALGLFLVIAIIAFFSLNNYTDHGESVVVPELKNKNIQEAIPILEYMDLHYEIIDSVYMANKPSGTIIEQIPAPHEKIKKHRKIYLTINSYAKPLVSLPDVRDLSYRNARATIEALGLRVRNVEYVPSEYKDLVKEVKMAGVVLAPGKRLPLASAITLVVGGSQSESKEIDCPSYRGLTYEQALLQLTLDSLSIRTVQFDQVPKNKTDSSTYFVYKQSPVKGYPVYTGTAISLWLTKDKSLFSSTEEVYIQEKKDTLKKTQAKKDIERFF